MGSQEYFSAVRAPRAGELVPGSARVSRAGERVLAVANFFSALNWSRHGTRRVRFGEDPETSARDALSYPDDGLAAVATAPSSSQRA